MQQLEFSAVSKEDLLNLGLKRKLLRINRDVLTQRLQDNAARAGDRIKQLCTQISHIHRFVGMRFEPGPRMIMDAILLAVAEISADITGVSVAILPLLRLADGDGINIVNPETGFQLCLIGDTDYGLYTYLQESDQSYALDTAADTIASYAHNCVPLVTGKREDQPLYDSMPEAVSQAIVLSEVTQAKAIRFCLSDGWNWIFSLLTKDEHGNRVYYEGEKLSIIKPRPSIQGVFEDDVHQIVALVYHWLVPSDDPLSDLLYTLKDVGRCY